jgi:hypothetical protein
MKGKFDAYVLWPLAKSVQNWIVHQSTARDFTVNKNAFFYIFYSLVPKIEICLKYFLERNPQKQPLWYIFEYILLCSMCVFVCIENSPG